MSKKINLFLKGTVDVLPLVIPVVPFGVIVGAIGIELGFTPLETYATSLIIFGGASQIVFLQLFSGGASSIITISSTFVVLYQIYILRKIKMKTLSIFIY
jgi:predicted branched-subunit amino acid permease